MACDLVFSFINHTPLDGLQCGLLEFLPSDFHIICPDSAHGHWHPNTPRRFSLSQPQHIFPKRPLGLFGNLTTDRSDIHSTPLQTSSSNLDNNRQ